MSLFFVRAVSRPILLRLPAIDNSNMAAPRLRQRSTWTSFGKIPEGYLILAGVVAARVLEAVRDDELFIVTHTEFRQVVEQRFAQIEAAFDRVDQSAALKGDGARSAAPRT